MFNHLNNNCMSFKVILEFTKGSWKGVKLTYENKACKCIGRSEEPHFISLPESYSGVSRKHCLLDINPPFVTVKDLGSMNGTYITRNGSSAVCELIGQRSASRSAEETAGVLMKHGDRLHLGANCEIQLSIKFSKDCAKRSCIVNPQTESNRLPHCSDCEAKMVNHRQIAGYNYIKSLGSGIMGVVRLVQDMQTGEERAMKFMLPDVPSTIIKKMKEWFLREIEIGKQIVHKNVVRQYESGQVNNFFYLVMEYCRGGNLRDFVEKGDLKIYCKRNGEVVTEKIFWGESEEALKERIPIATNIILQVLDGLDYIHHATIIMNTVGGPQSRTGLVHRDVKPENILLADQSVYPPVRLGDFGLSKAFDLAGFTRQTYTGFRAGCVRYIPKQQIESYKYSKPEVDVWAAAAVYYYMLTGLMPKDIAESSIDIYTDALDKKAVPIRDRNPLIPGQLAEVIDQALEDDPEIGIKKASELKNRIIEAT